MVFARNSNGNLYSYSSRCNGARRDSIEISTNILIYPQIKRIYQQSYHPSGSDVNPSEEDINITKRLIDAGKIMGIDILDHIIIGENGKYYSFKEEGRL